MTAAEGTARFQAVEDEFRAQLDRGFCGNRSSDLPLDDPFPPAVCLLPTGHDGMHSNGHCSWIITGRAGA